MLRILQQFILTALFAVFASQASAMFIQADTLDPTEQGVGTNRYAYSANDPINKLDPNGNQFHDWHLDQDAADADNRDRADRLYDEVNRMRDSDRFIDKLNDFFGADKRLENFAREYEARIGVSVGDRVRMDVGDFAAQALMGIRPGVGAGAVRGAIPKNLHTPINGGPLPPHIASTFRGGTYSSTVTTSPTTLYRSYGGSANPVGGYWSRTKPQGAMQSQLDSGLAPQWGNTAQHTATITVPRGVTIYEGAAAPQSVGASRLMGGGNQVYIPRVDPKWLH